MQSSMPCCSIVVQVCFYKALLQPGATSLIVPDRIDDVVQYAPARQLVQ